MRPVADRCRWDAEGGHLRLADAEPAGRDMFPWEEGQDRARIAAGIAEIEVPGGRVVEIHRLLDQAQAEHAAVEVEIAAGGTGDGGDVVNAVDLHDDDPPGCEKRPSLGTKMIAARQNARSVSLHISNVNL